MSKQFRSCDLNQAYLLPPSLQDWLPEDHLARFVAEVVESLNLSGIYAQYEERDGRGLAAYDPRRKMGNTGKGNGATNCRRNWRGGRAG
jgi:transposase